MKNALRVTYGIYATAAFVLVVLILFCPLLIVAPTLNSRRAIGRVTVRAWLLCCFVSFRVSGKEHVPNAPCIVVCNHASYVDGILLTAALSGRFTFLVQHDAEKWPYIGLIIRRMGVSFVNRFDFLLAARAVGTLVNRVRAGESFAIFPEGTFDEIAALKRFHKGAFFIAARTGMSIVPAVIRGSRQFYTEGQKLPRWSAINIEFLAPIQPQGRDRASMTDLCDQARLAILARCGEPDGAHCNTPTFRYAA